MKRFLYLSMALIFLLAMFPAAAAAKGNRPAPLRVALTLIVNSTNDVVDEACDATHCSLREAIQYSAAGDTIIFDAGILPATITLTSGSLQIDKALTITGPGADKLTISGSGVAAQNNHVFELLNPGPGTQFDVTISGLTIKGGRASYGGGINKASGGKLTLKDCVIGPNNIATSAGGGISVFMGTLEMNRSSVVGNQDTGAYGGAGIYVAYSTLNLTNSTVSGNVTNNLGAGILVDLNSQVNLKHSTVTANIANQDAATAAAGGGGGIYIDARAFQVQVQNSIVAGNTDLTNPATANHAKWPDVYGTFTSQGGNLIGDRTGSTGWSASDRVGTAATPINPLLGALAVNTPGITPTHALLEGSTAIEAAPCLAAVTEDQRGVARPQPALSAKCDAGAYESDLVPPADTTAPVVTVPANMTVAPTSASGAPVTFDATAFDNVDGALTPICTPASGATFPIGNTIVTCTATDAALNESSASFTVTVTGYTRVGAISMAAKAGHTYTYSGSVTILGYGDLPVNKAAVTVAWYKDDGSGFVLLQGVKSSLTNMTNRLGVAKFTLRGETPLQSGTYKLCVENVVKPGLTYLSALNTPTCGTVAVPIP